MDERQKEVQPVAWVNLKPFQYCPSLGSRVLCELSSGQYEVLKCINRTTWVDDQGGQRDPVRWQAIEPCTHPAAPSAAVPDAVLYAAGSAACESCAQNVMRAIRKVSAAPHPEQSQDARLETLRECEAICNRVRYESMLIHDGTTKADPDHERFKFQSYGADECAYKIRALIDAAIAAKEAP